MTWHTWETDTLLTQDFDDVVDRVRSLEGKDRTFAIRDVLDRLRTSSEPLHRLKALLFIQALLATIPDGKLAATVADVAALELAHIVMSAFDPVDVKRPALDSLALLFIKARELTIAADNNVRAAFTQARTSEDARIREFATRAFADGGVLSQRVMTRQYRIVNVSIKVAGATAAAAAGYAVFKAGQKKREAAKAKPSGTAKGTAASRTEHSTS